MSRVEELGLVCGEFGDEVGSLDFGIVFEDLINELVLSNVLVNLMHHIFKLLHIILGHTLTFFDLAELSHVTSG